MGPTIGLLWVHENPRMDFRKLATVNHINLNYETPISVSSFLSSGLGHQQDFSINADLSPKPPS